MEVILFVLLTLIVIVQFLKEHIHILPCNAIALEKHYSIFKKEYIYRVSTENKPFFTFNKKSSVRFINLPSENYNIYFKDIFKDYSKCELEIKCNVTLNTEQSKLKNIYEVTADYSSRERNKEKLQRMFNLCIEDVIRDVSSDYYYEYFEYEGATEAYAKNVAKKIEEVGNYFFNVRANTVNLQLFRPATFEPKREPADMNIESLTEAAYDLQQINQILKANDKGIVLSSISPLVPERVFRKIREKYHNYKNILDSYIEQLSIINKTPEQINEICEKIMNL